MDLSRIPEGFVSKYYEMTPDTEDLLESPELKDGMIVLIDGPEHRESLVELDPQSPSAEMNLYRLREINRWCMIDSVRLTEHTFVFIATYADGTKRKRRCSKSDSWIVKLDSMIPVGDKGCCDKGCCDKCLGYFSRACQQVDCNCHKPKETDMEFLIRVTL
jgi:hypothetical protein